MNKNMVWKKINYDVSNGPCNIMWGKTKHKLYTEYNHDFVLKHICLLKW